MTGSFGLVSLRRAECRYWSFPLTIRVLAPHHGEHIRQPRARRLAYGGACGGTRGGACGGGRVGCILASQSSRGSMLASKFEGGGKKMKMRAPALAGPPLSSEASRLIFPG